MRFFPHKKSSSRNGEIRLPKIKFERPKGKAEESGLYDNAWVQSNDSESFNNYIEEY